MPPTSAIFWKLPEGLVSVSPHPWIRADGISTVWRPGGQQRRWKVVGSFKHWHNFVQRREGAQPETSPPGGRERSSVPPTYQPFWEQPARWTGFCLTSLRVREKVRSRVCTEGKAFQRSVQGAEISLAWFRALMRELPGRPGRIEWLVTVESENLQSHRQKTEETRYNKHLKKETGKSL